MKVVDLLKSRRQNWDELDQLCTELARRRRKVPPVRVARFATLYRAACADLALANAYKLPPDTVQYLHQLVGRAHNQLYRSQRFNTGAWGSMLLEDAPRRIINDRCVQLAFALFWGVFVISAMLAYSQSLWPDYASDLLGPTTTQLETNFGDSVSGRSGEQNFFMAAFYIRHNTGIGLKCFAGGLLFIPGLFITTFNAAHLGGAFGFMARPEVSAGVNFFEFVRAHGPFELTAIVLSAGAGLRLGLSWLKTDGLTRAESMRQTATAAMPLMGAAMVLFFLAALIEGFVSPSAAPLWLKTGVALLCSSLLTFYFVVLGTRSNA